MQSLFIKRLFSLSIILLSAISYGQTTLTLKKGIVTDSLFVQETGNSFSVYLPKKFDKNRNWPVLIGFDSSHKTKSIVQLYQKAAEEFGYIVAVSDFKENQTIKEKTDYVSTFMNHIFSLLPIQKGRVYVTGVYDDAKLMSIIPVLYDNDVFGVVAIGDSHDYNSKIKITKNFSYFGIINRSSYRHKDLLKNKRYLNRKTVFADVLTYTSKAELPDLLSKVLSTFTLQAMLKGRVSKDSIWVKNLFQKDLKAMEAGLRQRKYVSALQEVKRIRTKYYLFFDTGYLRAKEKEIRQLKGYKKENRLRSKYSNREGLHRQAYSFALEEDIEEEKYENLGWWQHQISELDTLQSGKEKYAQDMALRVKGYIKNLIDNYKVSVSEKQDHFEKRMFLNILCTIIDTKDFEAYKTVISLSAQDEDYETALFYLDKLLKNGFKDMDALYNIEGTLPLRITKEYNKLIKKYLGTSRYFFSK